MIYLPIISYSHKLDGEKIYLHPLTEYWNKTTKLYIRSIIEQLHFERNGREYFYDPDYITSRIFKLPITLWPDQRPLWWLHLMKNSIKIKQHLEITWILLPLSLEVAELIRQHHITSEVHQFCLHNQEFIVESTLIIVDLVEYDQFNSNNIMVGK